MKIATTPRALVAVVAAAGVIASSALAAGEPKNTLPFTRSVGLERSPAPALTVKHVTRAHSISGESLAIQGEPKNEIPFTNPAGEAQRLAIALHEVAVLEAAHNESTASRAQTSTWADARPSVLVTLGVFLAGFAAVSWVATRPRRSHSRA